MTQIKLTIEKLYKLTVYGIKSTNTDFASIILNLMPRDNLGNKQKIIIHDCLINDEKLDLAIPPHRQSVGYIRTKRQTLIKRIINKQNQISKKRFSKQRNAISESETTAIQELQNLKDSLNKNHEIDDQLYFTDSETTSPASTKCKRKTKNCCTNKPTSLYNWNQPIRHIENYTLTVTQHKNDSK